MLPGVLLLLPSLFCCISQLLLPTVQTFLMSFQKISLLGSEQAYVGLENYARLFGDENFWRAARFTLTTLLVRLCVVALVPLILAWAASQFGRPLRLGLRILLTLPIVLFAPVAIAVAWSIFLNPVSGWFSLERSWAASPVSARFTLLFIDALYLFGLASGLGLIVYLPLWRRAADAPRPASGEVLKPMLATWALGILGIIALTLSTFQLNFVLTNGGPAGSTSTLGLLFYHIAFRTLSMGPAASVASLILLATLALGTGGGVLVILTRLRLNSIDTKQEDPPMDLGRSRALPGIVLAFLVLFVLGTCLLSTLPFGSLVPRAFGTDGLAQFLEHISAGRLFVSTFVPPLVTTTLQVLIAYLAALSIGALRPFGERSPWALLLFSPWLFITVPPLSLVYFMAAQKAGTFDTLRGAISPILISIPALFILTIFFMGRASQRQHEMTEGTSPTAPNFLQHFILPSLPLAAVLWLMLLFFNGQDIFWPLLVSLSPERYTLNLMLSRLVQIFNGSDGTLAAAITFFILPVCIFFFLGLAFFQILYLDRLTLYTEDPSSGDATPDPETNPPILANLRE